MPDPPSPNLWSGLFQDEIEGESEECAFEDFILISSWDQAPRAAQFPFHATSNLKRKKRTRKYYSVSDVAGFTAIILHILLKEVRNLASAS